MTLKKEIKELREQNKRLHELLAKILNEIVNDTRLFHEKEEQRGEGK